MKCSHWIAFCLGLGIVFAGAGCQTNQVGNRFAKEEIRLVLTGTPELPYSARYRVEGHLKKQQGVLPDEIIAKAGSFSCEVIKGEAEGELAVDVFIDGVLIGSAETTDPAGSLQIYRNFLTWTGKVLNSISGT